MSPAAGGNRIFNVADDAAATKKQVVEWLAAQVGRPPPRFSGGPASTRRGFAEPPDRLISNARIKVNWAGGRSIRLSRGYRQILSGLAS